MPDETVKQAVNLGPWIISAIALLQYWVIELYMKLRKPEIEIYESGTIEIGFSNFGPTIALNGTLRALHRDAFVKSIFLDVTRKRDNASYHFDWRAFRSNIIKLSPSDPINLELASSFLLTKQEPHKYNIFFVDDKFVNDIGSKLIKLPLKWQDFKNNKLKDMQEQHPDIYKALANEPLLDKLLYDEFAKSGQSTDEYTVLDRSFYWDACEYELKISIEATKPDKIFTKTFNFKLSDDDIQKLRLNVISIIDVLCWRDTVWYFAFPKYRHD